MDFLGVGDGAEMLQDDEEALREEDADLAEVRGAIC